MKRILKDYFTFSKKERTAVIILLLLIIAFITIPWLYKPKLQQPVINKTLADFIAQSNSSKQGNDSSGEVSILSTIETKNAVTQHSLFSFDPNTLSPEGWKKLGLTDKIIRTIFNYRNKGGRFRFPDDIRKIWGITKEMAEQLVPYVRIAEAAGNVYSPNKNDDRNPAKHPAIIDINTASSEEWQALPGIGTFLAERIVKYRERIGGFSGMDQFKKTYGISDSVFTQISPYLRTDPLTTPKVDLNTATFYDLKNKANIPEAIARAILVYRQQHGPYTEISDLKKLVFINDSLFQQVSKNLKVN